jgi:hypothetical protein
MATRVTVQEMVSDEEMDEILPWYVSWSGVWVGALSAFALLLVFGLTAIAVGAHQAGERIADWREFSLIALGFSVFGAFLSFVLGGWVATRIAGVRQAETAMLYGAIVWLLAVPGVLLFAALGAGGFFGTWYGGLAVAPPQPATLESQVAAIAARNGALGALTALLLGLVGGVIGGWMGSGERMTLNYWNRPYGHPGRGWRGTR